MSQAQPYPLLFAPVLFEKVWGGRRLASLGKALPTPDAAYGESWELADLRATSASGAGGAAVVSRVVNGSLAGKTLAEAMDLWGNALVRRFRQGGDESREGFPLLIKFLDARENLSVQVHPSPSYAAAHAEAHLKTECWYILDAQQQNGGGGEPAVIYKGLKPGVSAAAFERAARAGDASIVGMLEAVPAIPGECHDLPSGTVHALGAGVMVAEVQTPSDTTFRVYDWGRTGRVLHIDEAMQCIDFAEEPAKQPPSVPSFEKRQLAHDLVGPRRARLAASPYYRVDELRVEHGAGEGLSLSAGQETGSATTDLEECCVLMVLRGEGFIGSRTEHFEPCACRAGQTWLVPAAVMHDAMIEAESDVRALIATLV